MKTIARSHREEGKTTPWVNSTDCCKTLVRCCTRRQHPETASPHDYDPHTHSVDGEACRSNAWDLMVRLCSRKSHFTCALRQLDRHGRTFGCRSINGSAETTSPRLQHALTTTLTSCAGLSVACPMSGMTTRCCPPVCVRRGY
eukprot:3878883-Amphidinium_carterae.1